MSVDVGGISGNAAIVSRQSTKDKNRFVLSSHDVPPAALDRALEVGPDDWRAPGIYQLLTTLVVPRPIGWISTISESGIRNTAPYSYFN